MFRSRFFSARYWAARFWGGSPTLPAAGWGDLTAWAKLDPDGLLTVSPTSVRVTGAGVSDDERLLSHPGPGVVSDQWAFAFAFRVDSAAVGDGDLGWYVYVLSASVDDSLPETAAPMLLVGVEEDPGGAGIYAWSFLQELEGTGSVYIPSSASIPRYTWVYGRTVLSTTWDAGANAWHVTLTQTLYSDSARTVVLDVQTGSFVTTGTAPFWRAFAYLTIGQPQNLGVVDTTLAGLDGFSTVAAPGALLRRAASGRKRPPLEHPLVDARGLVTPGAWPTFFQPTTGADGSYTTADGKTVTVVNGIIVSIV